MNSNPFNFKYERMGHNDNSNLDNMMSRKDKLKIQVGDLVKINYNDYNARYMNDLEGIILEKGYYTQPTRKLYYKLKTDNATYNIQGKYIQSIEIIKTRLQIEDESKIQYPLIINHFTYTISIFKNQTAQVLEYLATSKNTLQIVDLSTFTNEEIFNMYNNDKELLTDLIIYKASINSYDTKIDKLLLDVDKLEELQDNLYDKIDDMIKEFKKINK